MYLMFKLNTSDNLQHLERSCKHYVLTQYKIIPHWLNSPIALKNSYIAPTDKLSKCCKFHNIQIKTLHVPDV